MATLELSPNTSPHEPAITQGPSGATAPWELYVDGHLLTPTPELEESQGNLLRQTLEVAKNLGVPDEQLGVEIELAEQMDAMHPPLCSHCLRVSLLSTKAAGLLGADPVMAQVSGSLHDVGKMGIDPVTLKKTVGYSPEDYKEMNKHSVIGNKILSHYDDVLPEEVPLVAGTHHKRQLSNANGMDDQDMSPEARKLRDAVTIADHVDSIFREDGRADNRTPDQREAQILDHIKYVLAQDTYNHIEDKEALAETIMHTLLETRAQILEQSEPIYA